MPRASDFEEKEFESSLVAELARTRRDVWTPGQVLENATGVEVLVDATRAVLEVTGCKGDRFGFFVGAPPYRGWLTGLAPEQAVPCDFRANLLLQAKRPYRYLRLPANSRLAQMPAWKIKLDSPQQKRLEELEARLSHVAVVAYVAPLFDTRGELWEATRLEQVHLSSTYPRPLGLQGHHAWRYCTPGAQGEAASEPEQIDFSSLENRVSELVSRTYFPEASAERGARMSDDYNEPLRELCSALLESMDGAARSEFEDASALLDETVSEPVARLYARVSLACMRLGLVWLVLTPLPPSR